MRFTLCAFVALCVAPCDALPQTASPTLSPSQLRFVVRCGVAWLGADSEPQRNKGEDVRRVVAILDPAFDLYERPALIRTVLNSAATFAEERCPHYQQFAKVRVTVRHGNARAFDNETFTAAHSPGSGFLGLGPDPISESISASYPQLALTARNFTNMEEVGFPDPRRYQSVEELSWNDIENFDEQRAIVEHRRLAAIAEQQAREAAAARRQAEQDASVRRMAIFAAIAVVGIGGVLVWLNSGGSTRHAVLSSSAPVNAASRQSIVAGSSYVYSYSSTSDDSNDDSYDSSDDYDDSSDESEEENRSWKVEEYARGFEEGADARREYPHISHFFLTPDFLFGVGTSEYYRAGFSDGAQGNDMRDVDDI